MTSLAAISPNAMANADAAATIGMTVEENEALISSYDGIIDNNSDLIGPLMGRVAANSDEVGMFSGRMVSNEMAIMDLGTDVAGNAEAINDNMTSLSLAVGRIDRDIKPVVEMNSSNLAMNSMMASTNASFIANNSDDIATASMGLDALTQPFEMVSMDASMLPEPETPEITWKDQVLTLNLVGSAVAAPTATETDDRQDYLDSIDVIFPMHKEYMPIIREFRCYEDVAGKIAGFEIEYWVMPVLDTRF